MVWGIHFQITPDYFDPAETKGLVTPFVLGYAIHDALIKPMPAGSETPSLAESWNMSADGKTYEFKIRKGVKFHNGDTLTAEDVKFSFERFKGMYADILKGKVESVEVVDPNLIRFKLKEPWPDFMTYYTSLGMTGANWIVPKAYVEKVGADGFKKQPIGAGPYKFVRFTAGVELVLEAFEDYWRKVPNVKTLRFRIIPEGSTRLAMLKTGEIDIAYVMEGALTDGILADPKLKFVAIRTAAVRYLIPTEQWDPKSPWSDLRVRQAASLALDRKTIMEARNPGGAIPGGIMPDDLKWALRIEPDPYDLGRAKSLLAAAGYPSGVDAGMLIGDVAYGDLLDVTATYWKAAGINVTVRKMERVAYGAALSAKSVRGVLLDLTSAGTAAERLERVLVTLAYGHYPDIDALMAQQAKEVDPKKREALLHDIQRLIKAKEMIIPTYNTTNPSGVGPRVKESNLARAPVPVWWSVPYEDVELAK